MECPKCNGSGKVSNPKYYSVGCSMAYEMGYETTKICEKCNGKGYIIGDISDIVYRLKEAYNGETITRKEAKDMLDIILK